MPEPYSFSYAAYRRLLMEIRAAGTLCDYADVLARAPARFILLRHDVEFSPARALRLGEIEAQEGVSSTFFFQLTNNAYNTLSAENLGRLARLRALGHHVGLHFHLHGRTNLTEIAARIAWEAALLEHELGFPVDRFSFHRPSAQVLAAKLAVPGLINAYAPAFFTYTPTLDAHTVTSVKYVADSRNEWSYCAPWPYPNADFFAANPKVQLLCHPYSWSEAGPDIQGNLRAVLSEGRAELLDTMTAETKYVKEYRDAL